MTTDDRRSEYAPSRSRVGSWLHWLTVGPPADASDDAASPPPLRARLLFAVVMALATAAYVYWYGYDRPERKSDFDQVWFAARALWEHRDPYALVGLGREFEWKWPFYYPLPAVVLVAPVGLLPVLAARCVVMAISVGLLAWALTRDGWSRVPAFLSMSFLVSIQLAQWSPLLAAAMLLPSLSWIAIAKPNWGVAIVAAASSNAIWLPLIAGTTLLSAIAFLVQPDWLMTWWGVVQTADHFRAPLFLPLGVLMLAAAFRWRRPEARLLLAIALVPHTPGFYDALMLFIIPRTAKESLLLTVCSYAVFFAMAFRGPWPADSAWMRDIAHFTTWFMYLPSVLIVLRRANVGTLPLPWRASSGRATA